MRHSDSENSTSKQTRRYLAASFTILLLVTFLAFTAFMLIIENKSNDVINDVGELYMHSMSKEISRHFETTINLRVEQVETIIKNNPPSQIEYGDDFIKNFSYEGQIRGFDYLALYGENGEFNMIYGNQVELEDKKSFYDSIVSGNEKVAVGHSVNEQKIIMLGVPISYDMGGGNKSLALVAGVPASYINEILSLDEGKGDEMTYSHIIRRDGTFVIRNADIVDDNYFDRIRALYSNKKSNADEVINLLKDSLEKHKDFAYVIPLSDGRVHVYITPLAKSEWNLVTVMPFGELDNTISSLDSVRLIFFAVTLIIVITVMIFIFTGYFRLTNRQVRELEKARAESEHANKAKSEFLSNMSHDIRTPMNAIVGMTAIATANIDNKQQVMNCLGKIALSGKHLLGLINDVLDMSKIESGKMTLSMSEVSLREVMESIVSIVQPQIKSKKQHFDVFISNIEAENVYCDSVRLNQIILNLLSNAIKFTPEEGRIEVKLYEEPSARGDNFTQVHLEVRDTGIGMTEEFKKSVFDAFSREDTKRVHKTEGTGLGMAITKYIVDAMGGTIDVESELGKGTHFFVTVDLEKAEIREEEMILPNCNMLVVDDDKLICETTAQSLKGIGIDAEWTLDGESAVKMVKERIKSGKPYQVILLDWKLPGIDGVETAKQIRQETGDDIPILLISAYDWSEIEDDARAAGVSGFISKPLFQSTLFYGLKQFVGTDNSTENTFERPDDSVRFDNVKILLAEDNELNWEIANELLSERGLDIDHAENGKICAEMFEKSEVGYYKAILMDIRMPEMSGYEAAKAVRAMNRPDNDIPIIAMTADAFSEDVKRCLDAGMNAHTAKPIDVENVARLLKKYIKE